MSVSAITRQSDGVIYDKSPLAYGCESWEAQVWTGARGEVIPVIRESLQRELREFQGETGS